MNSQKYDFGEFNKATFLEVVRHCELIFCLMTRPKWDLDEVEKALIEVVEWHYEDILFLDQPRMRPLSGHKATIQDVELDLKIIFWL